MLKNSDWLPDENIIDLAVEFPLLFTINPLHLNISTSPMQIGIVGSTNVGKSTLFNRLIGQFRAIVTDIPWTTRDIIEHLTLIEDIGEVTFLDSPGLLDFQEELPLIQWIIDHADLLLFVIDDKAGITAKEQHIYDYIRQKNKKNQTILVINKIDIKYNEKDSELAISDYHRLWLSDIIGVSAKLGRNINALKDLILDKYTEIKKQKKIITPAKKTDEWIRLAIVGKPNTGKSTLLNTLMGRNISKVQDAPGTTRDYITGSFILGKQKFTVYDTAGIKKIASTHGIDKIAYDKTIDMLKYQRPVVLFMIDVMEGLSHRDKTLIEEMNNIGLPIVICLNKSDLLSEKEINNLTKKEALVLNFAKYIPIVPISAKTRKWVNNVFKLISAIKKESMKRIDTNVLNKIISKEMIANPPRFPKNKICKLLYITQTDIDAPTFLGFINHKERANFAFKRWLDNVLRKHFGFNAIPLVIRFKERHDTSGKDENAPIRDPQRHVKK